MAGSWLDGLVAAEMQRVPRLRPEQVAAIRAVVNSPDKAAEAVAGHDAQPDRQAS